MCKCNPEVDVEYCWKGECKSGWGGSIVGDRSVLLQEEAPPCQHQWFEVSRINRMPPVGAKYTLEDRGVTVQRGVLVQCANCETTKELWG